MQVRGLTVGGLANMKLTRLVRISWATVGMCGVEKKVSGTSIDVDFNHSPKQIVADNRKVLVEKNQCN